MAERIPMTPQGKVRLQEELTKLKTMDRLKIIKEIETARGHGDLSENAEYHAAKEKQGQLEARILWLEDQLARSEVIDLSRVDVSKVVFGLMVTLFDDKEDKQYQYRIVGEAEAATDKGHISIHSPVARALIGKEIGDIATIRTPQGVRELEIVDIAK